MLLNWPKLFREQSMPVKGISTNPEVANSEQAFPEMKATLSEGQKPLSQEREWKMKQEMIPAS